MGPLLLWAAIHVHGPPTQVHTLWQAPLTALIFGYVSHFINTLDSSAVLQVHVYASIPIRSICGVRARVSLLPYVLNYFSTSHFRMAIGSVLDAKIKTILQL